MEFSEEEYEQLLKEVAALTESVEGRSQKINELNSELSKLEALLTSLRNRKRDLTTQNQEDRIAASRKQRELERIKRLREAQERRTEILAELRKQEEALDLLTAGAPWREFAFDHQVSGGKRLAVAKRGILADKRGLGKTLTSLVWLDMVKAKRVIVLAPNDVVPQFEDEIRQWQPHRTIFSLRGLSRDERAIMYPMLQIVEEFIITLNYEAWRKDKTIIDDLVKAGIDTIVCDEAHRIKSSKKMTAKGVFQLAYRPNLCVSCGIANFAGKYEAGHEVYYMRCPNCSLDLTSTVQNVLCMTGTPILNKPQELFSMLFLVNNQRFPSENQFLRDYCYSYAPGKWKFLPGGLDKLTNYMDEFFVQRTRDDIGLQVPPPSIKTYYIEKDKVRYKKQYEAEKQLQEAATLVLENGEAMNMLHILEIILRERQVMTWPAGVLFRDPDTKEVICNFDVEESQKLDEAMDLVMDLLEEGERVIVFSKFKPPLYEAHARVVKEGYKAVVATGDQAGHVKERVREDFDLKTADKENYRYQVCFATYDAFGTGINLNAARHLVTLDDEWSPGMQDQAIGRIDRLNSTDQANVHIFRVKKSIDEFMEQLLEMKRELTDGFESAITPAELMQQLKELDL